MNPLKQSQSLALAVTILGLSLCLAPAQTIPGIPEPGLVMYGSVTNTDASGSGYLSAGAVNWTISGNNSTSTVSSTIVGVNDQYFYIARVPFETRHIGATTLGATPNTLEFSGSGATYTRSATVNGTNAAIAFSSSGNLATFPFGAANRGTVERVDLQVDLGIELFRNWALRTFSTTNVDPNADADGDGMSNYQEYLAGTDPLNSRSLFILTDIRPDPAGGIDILWQSQTNKTYSIYRSTNLSQGFVNIQSWIPATPGTNTFRDPSATGLGPYFYRVKLGE